MLDVVEIALIIVVIMLSLTEKKGIAVPVAVIKTSHFKMRKPTKEQIRLWNGLVEEVFKHPKSKYSLFVYELIKRRVLGIKRNQYRATIKSDKQFGINNI